MLSDDAVLLLRVVNPRWVQAGKVTSQVFAEFDGKPISMFDGSMISAKDAFDRFSEEHDAFGVIGITVGELRSAGVEIIEDRKPYVEHISIRLPDVSRSEKKRISGRLRDVAMARGWLYIKP